MSRVKTNRWAMKLRLPVDCVPALSLMVFVEDRRWSRKVVVMKRRAKDIKREKKRERLKRRGNKGKEKSS